MTQLVDQQASIYPRVLEHLTPKRIGEFEAREFWTEDTWQRWKQELDEMLASRKKRGKVDPSDLAERALIESERDVIAMYRTRLYHSAMLGPARCACPRCVGARA